MEIFTVFPREDENSSEKYIEGVTPLNDATFKKPVLLLQLKKVSWKIPLLSKYPLVTIHFDAMNHFVNFYFIVYDTNKTKRSLVLTSKRSKVYIEENTCTIPLLVKNGWQYLCINISELLLNSYGLTYSHVTEIGIHSSSCKVAKLYLQEREHADVELPQNLQVFEHSPT